MPSPRLHGELTYGGKCSATGAEAFLDRSGEVHLARFSGETALEEGELVDATLTPLGVIESIQAGNVQLHSSHPMFNQIDAA